MKTKGPLDLFTSVRIHGLAHGANGEPAALTLDRSVSFPSPTWTCDSPGDPFFESLASRVLPTTGYILEARISPRKSSTISSTTSANPYGYLGYGLSSFVYSLDVIDIHPSGSPSDKVALSSNDPIVKSLPKLCIKVAQPTYSRGIAREAWFYEKLDEADLTGVVVPRCYGLFIGGPYNCPPQHNLSSNGAANGTSFGCLELNLPEYNMFVEEHFATNPRGSALLPEETNRYDCSDDKHASCATSPWFSFREDKSTISPALLVLEELPCATLGDAQADLEKEFDDLHEVFDDLRDAKIVHCDTRPPNILKAPSTAIACRKHGHVHHWFYIDWENALVAHHEAALGYIRWCKGDLRE
ncbi:protein kinase subdomain-containing protein PKL/ccin3 [Coprinopsis sp. MPI-PUGE-AT-0042]|nr:protein kinase subdomain-containing protein PKL/ccin3 [Coprinopsis sp. MPI-PUGE-AT-0042]